MDMPSKVEGLIAELDAAHARARDAYTRRDAAACIAGFHPRLEYVQSDGRTIDRDRLARDISAQLAAAHRATTEFVRESLCPVPDGAIEVLEQRATFEVRAFLVVHRLWTVHRRGRYEWTWTREGWQIRRVEVLSEEVKSRTWLALS